MQMFSKFCEFLQTFHLHVFENYLPRNKFIEKKMKKTKNDFFEWPDNAEYTFNTIRETFSQFFLKYINPKLSIRLETNVSNYALVGTLYKFYINHG